MTMTRSKTQAWLPLSLLSLTALAQLLLATAWLYRAAFPLLVDDILNLMYACRFTSVEYGTLYNFGYCGWRHLFPDLMLAFHLKQIAMIVLLSFLCVRLALAYRISLIVSCCIGLWMSLTLLRVNGTAYAALVTAMLGCIISQRFSGKAWLNFYVTLVCTFLIRTEYFVALLAGFLLIIIQQYFFVRNIDRKFLDKVFFGVAALSGCIALFGISRFLSAQNPNYIPREWLAFGQHFAANMQAATGMAGSVGMEWTSFVGTAFPKSHSMIEAMQENPGMFFWHVQYNIVHNLLPALSSLLLLPGALATQIGIALCIVLLTVFGIKATGISQIGDRNLVPVALAFVPIFGSSFIRPNLEYLLPLLPLLIIIIGRGIDYCTAQKQRLFTLLPAGLLCILLLGFFQQYSIFIAADKEQKSQRSSVRAIINFLPNSASEQAHPQLYTLFASWYADRICALLDSAECKPINFLNYQQPGSPRADSRSAFELFQALKVDWLLIGPDWTSLNAVQQDQNMIMLMEKPQHYGCSPVLSTSDGYVLLDCRTKE